MSFRYVFGPVTARYAQQHLGEARGAGQCLAFNESGDADLVIGPNDTWGDVVPRFPPGWSPDFVVLHLPFATIPPCLWAAPVPLVGLAGDWDLLWHSYRRRLPLCELALTDPAGVELLARQGLPHARPANLHGCPRAFVEAPWPDEPRDIDVFCVGDVNPAVRRDRLPWLGRLAALADRWNVVIRAGVSGDARRALLGRAQVVFHRGARGECGPLAFEAAAAGALLFQEAGNREIADYFRDRRECVLYDEDSLEPLLHHYLTREDERRAAARAARQRVEPCSFGALWAKALGHVEREWPSIVERARRRPQLTGAEGLLARTWQALGSAQQGDPTLAADLAAEAGARPQAATLQNALGVLTPLHATDQGPAVARAAEHFRRGLAADPHHPVIALNLVEALAGLGQTQLAVDGARRALALLQRAQDPDPGRLDAPRFPPAWDAFRVEWERAAWGNAGRVAAECDAKRELLRWRLHALLAELTGDLVHSHEAALARPDLPLTRALLGCALGRAGRAAEAVPHLQRALAGNPLDGGAARALYQALRDTGDAEGASRLARERRRLHRAAPELVPVEWWFPGPAAPRATAPPPGAAGPAAAPVVNRPHPGPGRPRVSLCLIVKDEEHNLAACLGSAADLVDEVVVVDTGSTDRTKEIAARFGAKVFDFAWVDSFAAARNESLRHATGDWIFWMDADDRLDDDNRAKLRALLEGLGHDNVAYVMKCHCLPDPATGLSTVVDHVRLFRNHPDIRWEFRVHEQILPAVRGAGGAVRWSDVVVHHVGYQDAALRRRKLERDLRLLRLEDGERPDNPFTLFNLGSVFHELGRLEEALPLLRRSLAKSHPHDSIVRKLYALVAQCHRGLGQSAEALSACREGLGVYPDDTELLFTEGLLRREQGDRAGAEASFGRLLGSRPAARFASVDGGLKGYKARHNLAVLYREEGRPAEAEALWRQAVAECPPFLPGWLGLADVCLGQSRWDDLGECLGRLERLPGGAVEAAVLRARAPLVRQEFAEARRLAEAAVATFPEAVGPRVILSHVLLQEGRDWEAAERALRDVLALDLGHAEARRNLEVLRRRRGAPG